MVNSNDILEWVLLGSIICSAAFALLIIISVVIGKFINEGKNEQL